MVKILITGVPGAGKTRLCEYLANERGFIHKDIEAGSNLHELASDISGFLESLNEHEDVVISWGFEPFAHRQFIEIIMQQGYRLIWLDGDRIASFHAFIERVQHNAVMERLYYIQMLKIMESDIVNQLKPRLVNPFINGQHKPVNEIADEIINSM